MPQFIILADLVDPKDPAGRTYRQVNAAKTHAIPLGALVELRPDPDGPETDGVRLYVVFLGRDCDQTPLYWLSPHSDDTQEERPGQAGRKWVGGYAEESLSIVRLPVAT